MSNTGHRCNVLTAVLAGGQNEAFNRSNEIRRLNELLSEASIPHDFRHRIMCGFQILCYGHKGKYDTPIVHFPIETNSYVVCSAIESPFCPGYQDDRIDFWPNIPINDQHNLRSMRNATAEEAFECIKKH